MSQEYVHPEVLVSNQWVADNTGKPNIRVLEVDWDPTTAYDQGHIEGASLIDWRKDVNNPVTRDIIDKQGFGSLLSRLGVKEDTAVVLYGDFNNWFATYAFWVFKYYGFNGVRLLNGGRKKWIDEGRRFTANVPTYSPSNYSARDPDESIRAFFPQVKDALGKAGIVLVDVRSPAEFKGEVLAPAEYPTEHAQRGGHIPGAVNQPWAQAVKEDGTFKSAQDIRGLYEPKKVTSDKSVITYCRIGERSAHSWFVLKYLLGYPNVKNYDGSWTEWGNMVRNPIEK